ncbi:hypothetical protein PSTT_06789 [Puccinia striiformis]|uniref:NADP-dependent oxidoreductase domain-containing protein n=1 Tax=Puccinia striiformis TaxID=27350 RepID=A0A2S4VJ47_9BASI|nr:hypothetical protein PSTT_06789 [Puccinia striiformis]
MSDKAMITLSNGVKMPQIGLGTWLSKPNEVKNAVTHALKSGYRHIDCAKVYGNLAEGLEDTLKELKTTYLDLVSFLYIPTISSAKMLIVLLYPSSTRDHQYLIQYSDTSGRRRSACEAGSTNIHRRHMERNDKIVGQRQVKAIGVSNFEIEHLEAIIKATGVTPSANQIERHPLCLQTELVSYCNSKNIHVTAYSPLGNNLAGELKIVDYPEVKETAAKISKETGETVDPAQVLIAWGAVGGISVIPKSVTPSRIDSNFKQVKLSDEDFNKITALGKNKTARYNVPVTYEPKWNVNVFNTEAEKSCAHGVILGI